MYYGGEKQNLLRIMILNLNHNKNYEIKREKYITVETD